MSHVAVVMLGAYGHINPTIPVVRELVARGTRVSYFCPPLPGVEQEVRAAGADFFPHSSIYQFKEREDEPRSESWAAFPRRMVGDAIHIAGRIEGTLRELRPDVIVHDFMALAGRIVGHALGIPTIAFYPTYPTNEHFPESHIVPIERPADNPERVRFREHVRTIETRWGLPAFSDERMYVPSPLRNIVFMPRAFHPAGDTFDDSYLFVGPSLGPRATASAWTPPKDPSTPLYFVSLGTAFSNQPAFFRHCLEGLSSLPGHVVMAIGNRFETSVLGPIPENATIAPYLPQLEVLPRCSVFVTHGGMNSVMESLREGVPMVVVPQIPEQVFTAGWVTKQRLGVALEQPVTSSEAVREAVTRVAQDKAIGDRVATMQAVIRDTGGCQAAAEAILSAAAS